MESPFLKKKYDLHKAPEVEAAAKRTERRTGEKVPQKPEAQIQNYLDRFKEITDREDPAERERGLEALKRILHRHHVIKPEAVPEAAFLLEQRIVRELGHGDVKITEEFKERKTDQIINNQKQSLNKWVDYLASPDAQYPDWAKYWAIRSVLEMGKLEKKEDAEGKETARYRRRAKDTVASFPTMNPRALALTIGVLRDRLAEREKPKSDRKSVENVSRKLGEKEFQNLLSTENFSKLYAQFLIEIPEYSTEGLKETRGKWVTYKRGSEPADLVKSLEGHPLEWCIADESTAKDYLDGGDILIYYSLNESGEPIIPRAAIRMHGDAIAEVRGIAPGQHTDPYIAPVIKKKVHEFPDGASYEKKASDMERLTDIETKSDAGKALTPDDLRFLYEFEAKIEGFADDYGARDPRINQIRDKREKRADLRVIFNCTEGELQEKELFTLKNIPKWKELPDPSTLKKDFKFDWIWEQEYRKGRPTEDFAIQNTTEAEPVAKVFEIGDIIRKKRREDSKHPGYLTTKEVLEAIDEAGYRPATLQELVAYSRDHWKPDIDPKTLTEEERVLQNAQAPYMYGLNSVFSNADGHRDVPYLYWNGDERDLSASILGRDWDADDRFLVLHKASS